MRKNKSLVYSISDSDFIKIVNDSYSCSEVLRNVGYQCVSGGASIAVKRRINELGVSTSHWILRHPENLTRKTYTDSEYFKSDVHRSGSGLKKRLLKSNLLEYTCAVCGNNGHWNNKKLILQVHHINGKHSDNRIENLQFICPNCHSQTEQFAGKNVKKEKIFKEKYLYPKDTIDKNKLKELVNQPHGCVIASKYFGVTDACIRRWCHRFNIKFKLN